MEEICLLKILFIFFLSYIFDNRRKLKNCMMIYRQLYICWKKCEDFSRLSIKCRPNSCIFNPLQFVVGRIKIKTLIFVGMFCASVAIDSKFDLRSHPQYAKAVMLYELKSKTLLQRLKYFVTNACFLVKSPFCW